MRGIAILESVWHRYNTAGQVYFLGMDGKMGQKLFQNPI